MRRIFNLLLAAVFACALICPAWAEEVIIPPPAEVSSVTARSLVGTPEELEEKLHSFAEKYPEEYAAFEPYAWYGQEYYYLGTAQEYMKSRGYTEAEFIAAMELDWVWYIQMLEDKETLIQVFAEANPKEYEAFDPHSWFAANFTYWETVEQYMETYHMSEWAFRVEMTEDWMYELEWQMKQRNQLDEFIGQYPELYEEFDVYEYFSQFYYYYDSPAVYMQAQGLTEEEFRLNMEFSWMFYMKSQITQGQYLETIKQQHGGYPDGINVMVNGQCLTFSDVRPEISDSRTMVPLRGVMEHLGAEVDYDAVTKTVRVVLDGVSMTHVIGTAGMTVYSSPASGTPDADGGREIQMDTPSYIKDGRTMIPVSVFARALGYFVGWDQTYQTAVLVAPNEMVDGANGRFTSFHRIWRELLPRWEDTVETRLELTGTARLVGGAEEPITLTLDQVGDPGTLNYTVETNLSALAKIYFAYYFEGEPGEWTATREESKAIKEMENASLAVISDDGIYAQGNLARLLLGGDWEGWLWDKDGAALTPLAMRYSNLTMGQLLTGTRFVNPNFFTWSSYEADLEALVAVIGEDKFTEKNGVLTWQLDAQGTAALLGALTGTLEIPRIESGSLTVTLDTAGMLTGRLTLKTAMGTLTATMQGDRDALEMTVEYEEPKLFRVSLAGTLTRSPTERTPVTTPPAGAKITRFEDVSF